MAVIEAVDLTRRFRQARRFDALLGAVRMVIGSRDYPKSPVPISDKAGQAVLLVTVLFAFIDFDPAASPLGKKGQLFPGRTRWLTPLVGTALFALAYRVGTGCLDS